MSGFILDDYNMASEIFFSSDLRHTFQVNAPVLCYLKTPLALTHFWPMLPFKPLENTRKPRFFGVFRGY